MASRIALSDRVRNDLKIEPVITFGTLSDIFDEEPVPLEVFVQDRKFLNNPALSPPQYDFVRHFEQIYLPDLYPHMVAEFGDYWAPERFVNFLTVEWGKGSGKDHVCRISLARVAYLLLCLKSPQDYFGMPPQDEIQTLNVAASATQAHRAFFKPLRTVLSSSPWFADKFAGEVPGEQASAIRLKKQIELVSGHSMAETLEGLNLIAAIADEISAFKTKDEIDRYARTNAREPAKSAEGILKMMRTSARTRFPRNFKLAQISYPRFKGDAIQQAVTRGRQDNEAHGEKSRIYVSGPLPTWEVNPRVSGKEEFKEDYDEDPVMALAMYECKPDLATSRYFRNEVAVYSAFGDKVVPPVLIDYSWGTDTMGDTDTPDAMPDPKPGWQVSFHYSPELVPMRGAVYAVHGDMAISGDRAGVAMTHVRQWDRREWKTPGGETLESRPRVKVDFVTAFEADIAAAVNDVSAPREVQIRWFRKLVFDLLRRGFNIGMVTFDNFQSADTIQILNSRGVESKRQSTDTSIVPWQTLRDVMYDGRLEGYWEPLVVDELLALTRLNNGKIDHPGGGSKDLADALAGSVMAAVMLGGDEGDEPERADSDGGVNLFHVGGGIDSQMRAMGIDSMMPDGFSGDALSWSG